LTKILVSDYDGTITSRDFYSLLAERYIPAGTPDYFAEYRAGRMTHFDAMAAYFAFTPTDESSLEQLLADSEPDPQLGEAAARLEQCGWQLWVVSAGSSWYIERVLARAGVNARLFSNPGRIVPGRGLVIERLPEDSPFYSKDVGVDKSAVVREALRQSGTVAFAGDGPPDLGPALLAPVERRFARSFLAEALQARGEGFRPYNRWSEIVWQLT